MGMSVHSNKNSGRPLLKEEDATNLSTKNFLNTRVNDAESLRSRQPPHILKVLGDRGPGQCLGLKLFAFDATALPVIPSKDGIQSFQIVTGPRLSPG